jgi:hypothetical protein
MRILAASYAFIACAAWAGEPSWRQNYSLRHDLERRELAVLLGDCLIPQFVNGDGWSTSITLVNLSTVPEAYLVGFVKSNGSEWPVSITGQGKVTEIRGTLMPAQTVTYETDGAGPLEQGWATVLGQTIERVRIGGFAVFRQKTPGKQDSEAVVSFGNLVDDHFVLVYDNQNGFVTGAALLNADPRQGATVTAIIRDQSGAVLGTDSFTLGSFSQTAFVLPSRFPATANRRGSILFSTSGRSLTGLGLRFSPFGPFTSFHALTAD